LLAGLLSAACSFTNSLAFSGFVDFTDVASTDLVCATGLSTAGGLVSTGLGLDLAVAAAAAARACNFSSVECRLTGDGESEEIGDR